MWIYLGIAIAIILFFMVFISKKVNPTTIQNKEGYKDKVRMSQMLATLQRCGITLGDKPHFVDKIMSQYYFTESSVIKKLEAKEIDYLEADEELIRRIINFKKFMIDTNRLENHEVPPMPEGDALIAQDNYGRNMRAMITMARSGIDFNKLSTKAGGLILGGEGLLEKELQEKIHTGFITPIEGEDWMIKRLKELKEKVLSS